MHKGRLDTLRCADQDRELVAQVLNTAYAEGRLTFDEHADRIAQAYDAKTFGDLSPLTTDLVRTNQQSVQPPTPPLSPPEQHHGKDALWHSSVLGKSQPWPSATELYRGGNAILSTLRSGPVTLVDTEVVLDAWFGEVKLDLVGTQFVSPETTIRIGGMACNFKVRVPEGVSVDISGLSLIMSDAQAKGIVPGTVHLRFVGTVIMGNVEIIGPALANQRKYARFTR